MKQKEETLINYLYSQLTEIYALKGVCLEILKDLEIKSDLNTQEQYWRGEIMRILFELKAA